jgi:cell division protein FtsN
LSVKRSDAQNRKKLAAPKTTAKTYFIEAGTFLEKQLAENLAVILAEIAPVTIDVISVGNKPMHRVRLGPFTGNDKAQAAVERIRAAGLTKARVESAVDG